MTRRSRAGDLDPDPEMWAALDGGVLRVVLEDFYAEVFADPRLAPFFRGVTKARVIEKQHSFMRQIFTGERNYFGDRPRNAHHWMVISDELFDHREELIVSALRRHGLPERLVQRWRAADECFRKQIVKAAAFGRKVRGVEMPLEGYESTPLSVGAICDRCRDPMEVGALALFHVRTGITYCAVCGPTVTQGG